MAEFLVNNGANINQGLNEENGSNPLLEAATNNHTELVEFFLARGAVVGIHFAAFRGDIDAVEKFIKQNVQINSTRRGGTPLNLAVMGNHKEIVSLLLDNGADISLYSGGGRPLDCAIRYNHLEIAELLIERGAYINHDSGSHPLRLAICQNKIQIVELLTRKGINFNSLDSLHLAASKGYLTSPSFEKNWDSKQLSLRSLKTYCVTLFACDKTFLDY
ncbi:ankyrin repeat-containing protein [Rivularia sp. PCC 7116]|nr:ankyrin repeat-containing protein [Rivularia sp. PCC 7116]